MSFVIGPPKEVSIHTLNILVNYPQHIVELSRTLHTSCIVPTNSRGLCLTPYKQHTHKLSIFFHLNMDIFWTEILVLNCFYGHTLLIVGKCLRDSSLFLYLWWTWAFDGHVFSENFLSLPLFSHHLRNSHFVSFRLYKPKCIYEIWGHWI